MNNQHIYCEIDFLQRFFSEQPVFNIEDSTKFEYWNKYLQFFMNNCSLILDRKEDYQKLVTEKNELFLILNKRSDGGNINIKFDEIKSVINQNDRVDNVFFLINTDMCKKLEEDYGLFFISNDTLEDKANILFDQTTISIEKNGRIYSDWSFIEKFAHPCNAMIIADNYILKNDKDVESNLITLLDKLLPKKLNKIDFQLTIITGDGKSSIDIENRYKLIKSELIKIGRPYKIELKIIGKSENNHDRNLITNYLHIYSGFGFILFRKKNYSKYSTLANTMISINSVLGKPDNKEMVTSLKKQYKLINSNSVNIGSEKIVYPENIVPNRLFENNFDR